MAEKNLKIKHKGLPRVAYISSEQYPRHNTDTQQVVKNANALTGAGLPLELIIPVQAKSLFNREYDTAKAIYEYYHVSSALKIRELPGFPATNLRFEKFFHSLIGSVYAAFNNNIDIVYTRNKFVALLCLLLGKKFIFETYRRLGAEYPKAMRWLAKRANQKAFLGMILHSHLAAESILRVGFPPEKLLVLHNGFDRADMAPKLGKQEARKKLDLDPEASYVVYTGNMQKNKCIEILIDIAALLPEVKFLLVGGTPKDLRRLKSYADEKEVKNLLLPGRQAISLVSRYLYAADVLIIPPVSAPLEKYGRTVLPFKIYPYLAAGRPIVAPDQPDMRELLKHHENAILVEQNNASQNALALRQLLSNPQLCAKLSDKAFELSNSLTWKKRAAKFLDWLEKNNRV